MLNMVEEQEALKDFSDQQLVKEIQRPSGNIRPISVVGELNRRKTSRQRAAAAEAANIPTVAEEAVAAAGMPTSGVTQMAQAMAPKTSMTENTGIAAMMPKQPTKMAGGGVIKANTGLPKSVVLNGFKYNVYSDGRVVPDMEGRPTTPLDPNMTNDRNIITQAIAAAKRIPSALLPNTLDEARDLMANRKVAAGVGPEGTKLSGESMGLFNYGNLVDAGLMDEDRLNFITKGLMPPTDPKSDPYASVVANETDTGALTGKSLTNMVTDAIDASTVEEDPSYYKYIPPNLRGAADTIRSVGGAIANTPEAISAKKEELRQLLNDPGLDDRQRAILDSKISGLEFVTAAGQTVDDVAGAIVGLYQKFVANPVYQLAGAAVAPVDALAGTKMSDAMLGTAYDISQRGNQNIKEGLVGGDMVDAVGNLFTSNQPAKKAPLMTDAQQAANLEDLKTTPEVDKKPKPENDPALEELKRLQAIESKATGSLMEFLKDLEKDKEKDAIMDLVRFGSILMKPTATIGEGISNAAIGTLDAKKERKKDYNKNKIAILGLSERIAAQKAAAARSNYSLGLQEQRLGLALSQQERLLKKAQTDQLAQNFELLGGSEVYEELSRKEELTGDEARRLSQLQSILNKLMPSLANAKTLEVADSA